MADRELKLIGRRGDGALLIDVADAPCVLVVTPDTDGDGVGIWANMVDAVVARGGWEMTAGPLPDDVQAAVRRFIADDGWCQTDDDF